MANSQYSGVHMCAFYGTTFASVSVPVELPALNDQVLAMSGTTGLVASRELKIIAAYMGGGTSARLSAPTLAQVVAPWIRPVEQYAAPGNNPSLCNLAHGPLPLPAGEALKIVAYAASGSKVAGLALLTDKIKPISLGPRYTITGTFTSSGTTLVVGVWQNFPITWSDAIPAGHYEISGFEVYIATQTQTSTNQVAPIASRLVLPGQTFRPGTLPNGFLGAAPGTVAPYAQTNRYLYDEVFGVLGEFDSFAMPSSLDMIDNGTATGYTGQVYLHIVRVSDAAGRPCNCG